MACIETIADLSKLVDDEFDDDEGGTVLYRGHGAASFDLRPRVGRERPPDRHGIKRVNEPLMLEIFRRQSVGQVPVPLNDDWELMAIAQHHGMATRMLDWSRNPLVALYLAVVKAVETRDKDGRPLKEDAEVIAWRVPEIHLDEPVPDPSPLNLKKTIRYIPGHVTPRLRVQSGVFTVHHKPTKDFAGLARGIVKLRVPHDARRDLKRSLFRHGIHEAVLFPDLDGLARHILWLQTDCH